jgi:hypothetical protein
MAGGGAVDSVNGQTGVVSLGLQEITDEGNETTNDILMPFDTSIGVKYKDANLDFGFEIGDVPYIVNRDLSDPTNDAILGLQQIALELNSNKVGFIGFQGSNDWSDNISSLSFTQKIYVDPIEITSNTTAKKQRKYNANGTLTITDPTPETNKGYIVYVIGGTTTIGGVGYTSGALVYRYYDGTSWISTNMNASGVAWGAITGTLSDQIDLQTELDLKAPIASPEFTGTPTAPTQTANDNSTKIATTAYVDTGLALKSDKARIINAPETSVTGVAVQTVLTSMLIPANTYEDDDAFKFEMTTKKNSSVTSGGADYKIYVGTTYGALTTQIGRVLMAQTALRAEFTRNYFINAGLLDTAQVYNTNALSAYTGVVTANTPVAVDMTNDLYITIAITATNTADINGIMGAVITPLK